MGRNEIIEAIYYIADTLRYAEQIKELNNCNDCAKKMSCEYRPEWGRMVRINCPLYKSEY